jgi:membrane associated rhomboid family serine protease
MAPQSHVAVIGASGAIAGVLGGYFVLCPGGRVMTLAPASIIVRRVEIPAVAYLLVWFALQLYSGISSASVQPLLGGVAWWAHVGGFLFGMAAAPLIGKKAVKQGLVSTKKRA